MDATHQASRKRPAPDNLSTDPERRAPYGRLKSVSLSLSAEQHRNLDQRVIKDSALKRMPKEIDRDDISSILSAIVRRSAPECNLKQEYAHLDVAGNLIEGNDALSKAVQDAWKKGQFAEVRELEILQSYRPPTDVTTYTESSLSQAFHDTFYARHALVAFNEYLTANCRRFSEGAPSTSLPYYGKYCSIVQSSGTGKSRLISELGKSGVMVIYMNLRDRSDTDNYPPRDEIAANLLQPPPGSDRKQYEARCSAFFAALFTVFQLRLTEIMTQDKYWSSASEKWQTLFGTSEGTSHSRLEFFSNVRSTFDAVLHELNTAPPGGQTPSPPRNSDRMNTTSPVMKLAEPKFVGRHTMEKAFFALVGSCDELVCKINHEPKVVIAIDEASILCKDYDGFRPSDVICTAISLFSKRTHCAIWVVFASTESRVADFAAPDKISSSLRIHGGGEVLYQPFTELGWDQLAPLLNDIDMDKIHMFDHIARFGRPLWLASKQYLGGGVGDVVRAAQTKLLKAQHYSDTEHQALALLSQRFALDIIFGHPQAIKHVEEAVASHLRICITTTEDRYWRFTSYPSEPLLSHAAADIMWQNFILTKTLVHLKTKLESGMIDRGKNGELVSRLLLLLAKDSCARRLADIGPEQLRYCCPIPVAQWLEELFGPNVWPEDEAQRGAAKAAFASATINFSHWISMSKSIVPASKVVVGAEEWLKRNFVRTSALQCAHEQHSFVQVIPSYDPASSSFSSVCVSVKLRDTPSKSDVSKISITAPTTNMDTGRPWIAVTLDLGVSTEIHATYPTKSVAGTSPCLRIYAAGMDSSTFPFLQEHRDLENAMKGIQYRAMQPPAGMEMLFMMRERFRIGTSPEPIHMRWGETQME